ncbi:MAG: flavin monoamine oxidase family protein [Polyangiaceae bacterium]|nr:flavin monoamine oxidase family protein [Polyangiaceae bacterium]
MPNHAQVIVVGAGISGLVAANLLHERGADVLVVEANDRVGGRTSTTAMGRGTFDLGGQWLGPKHRRMKALCDKFGLETFPTHDTGRKVLVVGEKRSTYKGTIPTLAPHKLALIQLGLWTVDRLAKDISTLSPWSSPRASEWDGMTVETWKNKLLPSQDVRDILEAAIRVIFGASSSEISMLHFLYYVAQAGGLMPLVEIKNGLQETRFVKGAQSVSLALADRLQNRVHLSSPARRISTHGKSVTVETDKGHFSGDHVIVAVPPTIAARIEYQPALPNLRDELMQRFPMGGTLKCHALYKRAFWREAGLSGEAVLTKGPVSVVFDNTSHDGAQPALIAFCVGPGARELGALPELERKRRVLDILSTCFGPDAQNPELYIDKDWSAEPWTRGCPTSFLPPGVFTTFGKALREPVGNLHWAGTETAREYTGYMEGACEAAERAVSEIT